MTVSPLANPNALKQRWTLTLWGPPSHATTGTPSWRVQAEAALSAVATALGQQLLALVAPPAGCAHDVPLPCGPHVPL